MGISKERKVGFLGLLLLSPIFFIFTALGWPEKGLMETALAGVFFAVAYVKRGIIKEPFFQITMAILFIIESAAVMVINTPYLHPGIIVMPFAILDLVVILAIIEVVSKLLGASSSNKEQR